MYEDDSSGIQLKNNSRMNVLGTVLASKPPTLDREILPNFCNQNRRDILDTFIRKAFNWESGLGMRRLIG